MNNAIAFFISTQIIPNAQQIEINTSKGKMYIRTKEFKCQELDEGLEFKPLPNESLMNTHWLPETKH